MNDIPIQKIPMMKPTPYLLAAAIMAMSPFSPTARASIAYGSSNNFDTVNDTGGEAHGFEIELEDCRSSSITYTFDWNHYGTPSITEDLTTNPARRKPKTWDLTTSTAKGSR